jgi:RNA polymerase sigma-70 factor (ECF subfamily)
VDGRNGITGGDAERSPFRAWLFRIARNHVISHYRRQSTRRSEGEVPEWIPDDALGPAEIAERTLTIEEVFAVVQALPAAQREVIQLRFGAGLSIAETAEALDKQQTNVKVLQHKGIKRLKELLEAADATMEEKRNR